MILSIDPGRGAKASIGYCLFREDGTEYKRGSLTWADLVRMLTQDDHSSTWPRLYFNDERVTAVAIENFVNDPRVRRGGQTNGASEVIGAVEFMCAQTDVPCRRQDRSILPVAKQYAQYVDTHKHLPHQDAAFLHGVYFLTTQGIWDTGISATLGGR